MRVLFDTAMYHCVQTKTNYSKNDLVVILNYLAASGGQSGWFDG